MPVLVLACLAGPSISIARDIWPGVLTLRGLWPTASRRVSTLAVRRVWLSPLQIVPFADCEEMVMDVLNRKSCHKITNKSSPLANTRFLPLVVLK